MRSLLCLCALVGVSLASPCREASALAVGERAPCSGILLAESQALSALKALQVELPTLKAEVTLSIERFNALADQCQEQNEAFQHALEKADAALAAAEVKSPVQWWRSPLLWGPAGFISGAVLVLVAAL